ncbi:metallophosphoesterase family protein, partial [Nocardia farcinica]
ERVAFRRGLLDEEADQSEPVDRVYDVNGLRIIALDSTVPGQHHGEISDEQLAWLRRELEVPAPDGTLIALHHPPVPSPIGLIALIELRDQERLAEAERRDHRKLGAELDLFSFPDELGSGLPVFHPRGGIIRKEMEDYSRRRHNEAGYEFVYT